MIKYQILGMVDAVEMDMKHIRMEMVNWYTKIMTFL
jgi:hypothetical protein